MIEDSAVRGSHGLLKLRLGDHLLQTSGDGEPASLQTAVALLRTVFEDHYVDPEHQSCLFFHGCTFVGATGQPQDFSVLHRDDRVILTDFPAEWKGPSCMALPAAMYAREIVRFGEQVIAGGLRINGLPDWMRTYMKSCWTALLQLVSLGRRFLAENCAADSPCYSLYHELHGCLKRPLELQVLSVAGEHQRFQPVTVITRVLFGPIRAGEVLPLRPNRGDVVLARVQEFTPAGVSIRLEGVGSGGICPGDRLYGLQLFYP